MKEKLLISSCLCGSCCKYNGGNNLLKEFPIIKEKYELILVCPEVLGGLSIPRNPSEIKGDKVYNNIGEDVTDAFNLGAKKALAIALENGVTKAILKESSPSCGVKNIYDGSFSGKKISGSGITTRLLEDNNIKVYSSLDVSKLMED